MKLRFALFALAALALLATSCDVLKKNVATSGPMRYKAEVASVVTQMKDELAVDGKVRPATKSKFEKILAKYEGDFKMSNSYRNLKEAQEVLAKLEADPGSFQHKQQVEVDLAEAMRALETEVRSD